ncbi:glycosyltransferase family 2 protein [Kineobactrum sediminis]|nr:glycosyltransferase family 2 protein [Kineobactrum sediminis]
MATKTPFPMPALSVSVVLHHSDLARLETTLRTLLRAAVVARDAAVLGVVSISIIDNSVSDRYHQALLSTLAGLDPVAAGIALECRALPANVGYGVGHNEAFRATQGDFHLVLNPDIELDTQVLSHGLQYLVQRPGTVLVCPRGIDAAGAPAYLNKRYPSVLVLVLRALPLERLRRCFADRLADYEMHDIECAGEGATVRLASGCFMLVRSAAFRAVGGFYDRYFLYFEDYDLSLRLAQQGAIEYLPDMIVRHYGGGSARKNWRHRGWFLRSGLRFFTDHGWRWI